MTPMPSAPQTIPSTPANYPSIRIQVIVENEYGNSTQHRSVDIAIKHILEVIEQSKHILTLEDDWDEEGSQAYTLATWERATTFLQLGARQLWEENQVALEAPKILPGPSGSIDLHWKMARRELLINIPESVGKPANFYGDDSSSHDQVPSQTVKGTLDTTKDNQWLMMWLMQ
jgi:hypothetical protein